MPESLQPSLAQNCATLRISGFRRLVGDDAEVNVDTGLGAAESCRSSETSRDQSDDIAEMRHQVSSTLDAVKSTVPQEVGA